MSITGLFQCPLEQVPRSKESQASRKEHLVSQTNIEDPLKVVIENYSAFRVRS